MLPLVAIVGRPNVGKSTLFNRIVGRRIALVEDRPGVTRDRQYAEADWDGRRFSIVDTGGFWAGEDEPLLAAVRHQAERAIAEAAAVLFVLDGRAGLTGADEELSRLLRRGGKPVFVAVNKIDAEKAESGVAEFWRLGWERLHPVSAEHGRGVGSLLDDLVAVLPAAKARGRAEEPDRGRGGTGGIGAAQAEGRAAHGPPDPNAPLLDDRVAVLPAGEGEEPVERPRVAILGRPNVGKSTFVNRLLGEARFVESPLPGTTRDAIDAQVSFRGREYVLTDTAGIRRKGRAGERIETLAIGRAYESLERADVAAVLVDATEPAVEQDAKILGRCVDAARPSLVVVNKADLLAGAAARQEVVEALAERLPFLPAGTPTIFVSAREGRGMEAFLPLVGKLFDQASLRLPTAELNRFLRDAEEAHPAPRAGNHPVRLYYMTQVGIRPPTFLIQANRPESVSEGWRRFLAARLRERWRLQVPVRLVFRERPRRARR